MSRLLLLLLLYMISMPARGVKVDSIRVKHVDSLLNMAFTVFYTDPDSSLYYTNSALDYAIKNKLEVEQARAWHSLARTEVLRGDIEQALKHLRDAVGIFEKNKLPEYVAKCYVLMSTALSKVNNHTECINLLLKAAQIQRQMNNTQGLRSTLVNLANSYSKINEFDKALEALNESRIYTGPGDNQWFYYYINAGIIQKNRKKYELAKMHFDSCIAISRRFKMVDAEVTAITDMAELYLVMKKFGEAVAYFNSAIKMARAHNLPLEESDALTGLLKSYESTGDYKNAFFCQNRLKVISDSLFNIEKIKNISAVETRLKVSEKEKTIALQKLDMEKSASEQEKSKKRFTLLIAGTLLLAVILFFTFYVYAKTRKQKIEVELEKNRAEKLNSLNQKIFSVIAHDFKSPLITLNMLIDLLDKESISKEDLNLYSADVRNQITQSGQILENLLNWAKTELNLSQNTNLSSDPFLVAGEIVMELNYMSSRKNIRIINELPDAMSLKVPPDILKIIIRNLVSNAVKFSFSNNSVIIGTEDGKTVFIKDNGFGHQ